MGALGIGSGLHLHVPVYVVCIYRGARLLDWNDGGEGSGGICHSSFTFSYVTIFTLQWHSNVMTEVFWLIRKHSFNENQTYFTSQMGSFAELSGDGGEKY